MKQLLFIAPVSAKHGEGFVGRTCLEIVNSEPDTTVICIDSNLKGYTFVRKFMSLLWLYFRIVFCVRMRFSILYLSFGRTINTNLRDILAIIIVKLRNPRCKIVAHIHGAEILSSASLVQKIWYKICPYVFSRVIILSDTHARYVFGAKYQKYIILPNPIENKPNINFSSKDSSSMINFLFVSNPIAEKGLDTAIEWFSACLDSHDAKLTIIGWSREDYEKIYKASPPKLLLAQDRINFLGKKFGVEKNEVFFNSDIFLFPTRYVTEAQPLVLIEALYFNLKLITSRIEMLNFFEVYANHYYWSEFETLSVVKKKTTPFLNGSQRDLFNSNHGINNFRKRLRNAVFS